ncbi:hypothetical protein HYS49_01410, partial [Candidatus Woesearchaeota archaeon]|nr:hypothetical protein [Candidatus Woesearchaeota archaeon]
MKTKKITLLSLALSGFLASTAAAQEQNGSVYVFDEEPNCPAVSASVCPEPEPCVCQTIECQACPEVPSCPAPAQCAEGQAPETPSAAQQQRRQRRHAQQAIDEARSHLHYAALLGESRALRQFVENGLPESGPSPAPQEEDIQERYRQLAEEFRAYRVEDALRSSSIREELRRLEALLTGGPSVSFTPRAGVEVYGGSPSATMGVDLCVVAEKDDLVGGCLGGQIYVAEEPLMEESERTLPYEQRRHEGDFSSTSQGTRRTSTRLEGLGALQLAVAFHAVRGNPSLDLNLGAAVRFAEQSTMTTTNRRDQLYSPDGVPVGAAHEGTYEHGTPEELTDTLVPFGGFTYCHDAVCLGGEAGVAVEDG